MRPQISWLHNPCPVDAIHPRVIAAQQRIIDMKRVAWFVALALACAGPSEAARAATLNAV
jgi:hypothetical protein